MNRLAIRADELEEAAHIIKSQLPHANRIWISSMISQNIGSDASHLVQDIRHVEVSGRRRKTTWPRLGDRKDARRSRNTMCYQVRGG
jgi:hypothetical protein